MEVNVYVKLPGLPYRGLLRRYTQHWALPYSQSHFSNLQILLDGKIMNLQAAQYQGVLSTGPLAH